MADGLETYPWSSLNDYLAAPSKRRKWIAAGYGLEASGLRDTATGRRKFLEHLEERASREGKNRAGLSEIEGQSLQSTLRRGWYFGEQAFREVLEKTMQRAEGKKKGKHNYTGGEMKAHGEARAQEIVIRGMKLLDLNESDLMELPKSEGRKVLIAFAVKRSTTVSLEWIAGRLSMGVRTGVSRYVCELRKEMARNPKLAKQIESILEE